MKAVFAFLILSLFGSAFFLKAQVQTRTENTERIGKGGAPVFYRNLAELRVVQPFTIPDEVECEEDIATIVFFEPTAIALSFEVQCVEGVECGVTLFSHREDVGVPGAGYFTQPWPPIDGVLSFALFRIPGYEAAKIHGYLLEDDPRSVEVYRCDP